MKVIFVLLVFFLAAGSACSSADYSSDDTEVTTFCHDPRPQVCTTDYTPVCGNLKDGTSKTYPNDCTACSAATVDSFSPGECEE